MELLLEKNTQVRLHNAAHYSIDSDIKRLNDGLKNVVSEQICIDYIEKLFGYNTGM